MLKDYQIEFANLASEKISKYGIAYLGMEVRTGKTRTALKTAEVLKAKNVLFVTKKNAIEDIINQYHEEEFAYPMKCINYEQIHKEKPLYDLYILDEAHCLGGYPKPSEKTKHLKTLVRNNNVLFLSGTPWTESGSKLYHQFWITDNTPFEQPTFYKWAKEFVIIEKKRINGYDINCYDKALLDKILNVIDKYIIKYSQKDAGFEHSEVQEEIKFVEIDNRINIVIDKLIQNGIYTFKDGSIILADTPAKKQTKTHQLYSGTVKTEDGTYKILDYSKANYIKQNYTHKKIAIFYKFIAEGIALKETFDNWTENAEEFNNSDNKVYIKQIQSGSMGVNLATADVLIIYNIDFSVTQYLQARARIQNMNRKDKSIVHFLFSIGGIESKIYECLQNKKDYTMFHFIRDYVNGERIKIAG